MKDTEDFLFVCLLEVRAACSLTVRSLDVETACLSMGGNGYSLNRARDDEVDEGD